MSIYWWLCAVLLVSGYVFLLTRGSWLVEHLTGREPRPEKRPSAYDAVYFGLAFMIGMPPIWLLPDRDPLVYCAFSFAGIIIGDLAAQAMFGRIMVQ